MSWSFADNKVFENALAEFGVECPNLFQKIASRLPQKSIEEIQEHYKALVKDVEMIDLGHFDHTIHLNNHNNKKKKGEPSSSLVNPSKILHPKVPRKKPTIWTDDEHEAFIRGVEKYGKGDWKSISRHCVQTRTPAQIASHAQKYFQKLQRYANKKSTSKSFNDTPITISKQQQSEEAKD